MTNDTLNEAEQTMAVYEKLYQSVPPIGFLSRKKRVLAYLSVTQLAQTQMDSGALSADSAEFVLSLLPRKHAAFQKATMMAALHLATIDKALIAPIGFQYANAIRCNMKLLPVA